jgi:23S rRNA pseudouridine2605 synthase
MTGSDESSGASDHAGEPWGEREGERIAKLLARAGIASRREIERMIADKRIALNGEVIETPATLLTSLRGLTVDGKPVAKPEPTRLFRFHKPAGLITAERDPAGRPTIYDALRNALPPGTPRMMPIGRLDFSTEGLLLMTNDGEFKRLLELPANGVPRTYRARTFGDISQAQLEDLMDGVTVEGVNYGRIDANLERRTGRNQWIELTLSEGKNREVRRVLEHLGLKVSRLIRTAYGPFVLGDLRAGGAEEVRREDLDRFRSSIKRGRGGGEPRESAARPEGEKPPRPARAPRPAATATRGRARPASATGEGPEKPKLGGYPSKPRGNSEARDRAAFSADGPRPSRTPSTARAERASSADARGQQDRRPARATLKPGARREGGEGRDRTGAEGNRPRTSDRPSGARSERAPSGEARGRSDRRPDRSSPKQDERREGGEGRGRTGAENKAPRSFGKPATGRSEDPPTGEARGRPDRRPDQASGKRGGRRDGGPSSAGTNAPDRSGPRRGSSSPGGSGRRPPSGPQGGRPK